MKDILRDSTVGQFLNYVSKGRILPYADQRPDYVIPSKYLLSGTNVVGGTGAATPNSDRTLSTNPTSDAITLVDAAGVAVKNTSDLEKGDELAEAKKLANPLTVVEDPYLVTWEGPNDPDNPRNWSKNKRVFVGFLIALLTFSVYIGSAVYTPAIPGIMADFGVSQTQATWGLTLFVLAYGIGPTFGRNPAYIGGLFLFVLFQVPAIFAKNISTILAFRFFAGFVGSPALATGAASMGDIFPPLAMPYAIGTWAIGAVCGPVLGPAIGGFAAQANGWRWPFYILLWISGFALIVLTLLLPETFDETILLRRAQRLRKLTGNPHLRSQSEIDAAEGQTLLQVAMHNFVMAFRMSVEPAIGFANVYIGLIYAIFYLWFEAFPLVFTDIHHFNLGLSGLPFLGFVVSGGITFFFYVVYNKVHMEPRYLKNPDIQPEVRLELAIVASIFIPISLFLFGWSSKASVHWIVPIIGAALYLPGIYLNFQSILMYLAMGYPTQAVPIFAGNDLFRSTIASFFPLFGKAFFDKLGLGGGSSLLAGLSILMIPVLYALMKFGGRLRARSKWTN
ncbi:MFS transporter, DHA1 family, multidrug resistance protein [Pseudohyphozyma bogoriensis]|nr:MFS transporter, DHA1 family, multidrug resistance protein [Pseudohyphozyma bogoriensis]